MIIPNLRRSHSALDERASSPTRDIQSVVLSCNRDEALASVSTSWKAELPRVSSIGSLFVRTRSVLAGSLGLDESAANIRRLLDMALLIKSSGRSPTSAAMALRHMILQIDYAERAKFEVTHSAATWAIHAEYRYGSSNRRTPAIPLRDLGRRRSIASWVLPAQRARREPNTHDGLEHTFFVDARKLPFGQRRDTAIASHTRKRFLRARFHIHNR